MKLTSPSLVYVVYVEEALSIAKHLNTYRVNYGEGLRGLYQNVAAETDAVYDSL
jgi:hypothetical protein